LYSSMGLADYKPVSVPAACATGGNHSSGPQIAPQL
jgi:hypothetical protein